MPSPLTIEEAKLRLRIPDLWRIFNLPGAPKVSCKSPFREERCASFSVSSDGMLFNDFATGMGGDAVAFFRLATGLSLKEAVKKFIERAGGQPSDPLPVLRCLAPALQAKPMPSLPLMRRGTDAEHKTLAALRHIHIEAVKMADRAGLLRFGVWKGYSAWFITEPGKRNAQVRKLNGQPWVHGGMKAQTLPGCWASWPICAGVDDFRTLCFVEGGPDLLAAWHFIINEGRADEIAPVAIMGASLRIHPEALPLFGGKRIRIFAHADEAGRNGASRWWEQLKSVGCQVDAVDLAYLRKADATPIKDLNDCTQIHPDYAGELEGLLPE